MENLGSHARSGILCAIALLPIALHIKHSNAFPVALTVVPLERSPCCRRGFHRFHRMGTSRFATYDNDASDTNEEDDEDIIAEIPLLPPPGGTKATDMRRRVGTSSSAPSSNKVATFVNKKFTLQYTCNICETRNTNKVSRKAYRKGVVIAVCKGCMSKHLIADNLNWSQYIPKGYKMGETNIEDFFKLKGQDDQINRVSKDVWELEQIIQKTESSDRGDKASDRK